MSNLSETPSPLPAKLSFSSRLLPAVKGCYGGGVTLLVACLLSFTACVALWSELDSNPVYPDPAAGVITLLDESKAPDFLTPVLFISLAIFFAMGIGQLYQLLTRNHKDSRTLRATFSTLLLLSLVPALFRLTNACVVPASSLPPLKALAIFPCAALLTMALLLRYRDQLTPAVIRDAIGSSLLIVLFASFSTYAVLLAASRLTDPAQTMALARWLPTLRGSGFGLAALAILGAWGVSSTPEIFVKSARRLVVLSQSVLPLFFLQLVPPPLLTADGSLVAPIPQGLRTTLLVVATLCFLWGVRRFIVVESLSTAVRKSSVAAILIFLFVSYGQLPTVPHDYFHSGEQIVPWQQVRDFHKIPFVDFAPIHGLLELMVGIVNQTFYDGTLANYWNAVAIMVGLSAAALGLAGSALLSPLGALIFILACPPYLDRMYFVAPAIFVLALPRLLARPALFLWCWAGVVMLSTLYSPTVGPALVLASVPLIAWQLFRLRHLHGWNAVALHLGIVAAIGLTVLAIPPTRQVAIAFVHFVLDNAWTNTVANAVPWSFGINMRSTTSGTGSTQFLWESLRFAWIPFAVGALAVLWRELARPAALATTGELEGEPARRPHVIVLSLLAVGFVLCVGPWSLGRIDGGNPSRPWAISQCAISFLLPAIVILAASERAKAVAVALLAVGLGFVHGNAQTLDTEPMVNRSVLPIRLAAGTELLDGKSIGMPNIGKVIKPDFLPELVRTKKVIDALLVPGAPYLDLTNRQALYCYLDRPAPVLYPAYVAANGKLQRRMVDQLKKEPVDVVMVHPAANFDGLSCSIRCYRLYRDYVLSFVAIPREEFIFLVHPNRVPGLSPGSTEEQLALLDQAFRPGPLAGIPRAWGRSWKTLSKRFDSLATIAPEPGTDGSVTTFNLPATLNSGADADFVRITVDHPGNFGGQAELRWVDANGKLSEPISFGLRRGESIIPIGAFPRWLLGKSPKALQLKLSRPAQDPAQLRMSATLLKLKDL